MQKITLVFFVFHLFSFSLFAQEKWDVNNPPGPKEKASFQTTEGTWMNLDLSPDGKQIVFDLLGDIYIMPSAGGEAKVLRQGYAYEVQPRFSPDGQWISFTSDAGGGDNIWVMRTDGSEARQVTQENFRLVNNATWTPDGQYLIARKHFTSERSAGAGEMWMYHLHGKGKGLRLTERKNDQQDVNEPCVSPDGKFLYFSEDMYPGGFFQYNKNTNKQIYVIRRLNLETGELENLITGGGGAFRPVLSRDGKKLAFVRRVRTKSVLFVQDLETGKQQQVTDSLDKDQQEAWALFGVYTNYSWTPDDKHILIWAHGKIQKIEVATGKFTPIEFKATCEHEITKALRFKQQVFSEEFTSKVIRHAKTSPDGKWLIFNAAGYLWKKALPNGTPERLTDGQALEYEPSFSPDGQTLTYVTWSDEDYGKIMTYRFLDKKAKPEVVSLGKALYREPSFSPDGEHIVFRKEAGNNHQGFSHATRPGLYILNIAAQKENFLCKEGTKPHFAKNGERVFFQTGGYLFGALKKGFHSVNLQGQDKRTHFTSKYANQFALSPDENWIAFGELHKVYVAPFPKTGQEIELKADATGYPIAQLSRDAGINLHWSADSKTVHWTLGDRYFSRPLKDKFSFLSDGKSKVVPPEHEGVAIGLTLKTDVPEGMLALQGARIITMNAEDEVIEDGVILIEKNKIKAVGKRGEVQIPEGVKTIDAKGKTIIPGLVDVHAHVGNFRYGISPEKQWHYFANLAYGVTTIHDPSSNSEMVFSQAEMVKTGRMLGPRIYSTGTIIYGADGDFKAVIDSLGDALSALRRTQAYGAFSVKSYNQPRRNQRQQVIQAARQLKMNVVPEGGSHFLHNMSMILDGHTGIEHNIPVGTAYDDVVKLWSKSETGYTPTLIVCYGAVNGEYYWYQHTNVWEKSRLLNFTPRTLIDARSRHRTMLPEEDYETGYIRVSRSCKKLADAGVRVNVGGHGQLQGLGVHWELWMLGQGGMSPQQALRCATMNGAYYIGMEDEIGSLEKGKLADLVVLDKNPLEKLENTEFVHSVMKNGRLYDAETMNEIGNYDRKRGKFYWEHEGANCNFPAHLNAYTRCSCRN